MIMKKGILAVILGVLILGMGRAVQAEPGDTVRVHSKDTIHWSGFGGYFTEVDFPETDKSYERVWLKATLGCPSIGCSDWDYTTKFAIMDSTGVIDSNKVPAPKFRADGEIVDSLSFVEARTYHYTYDKNSNKVDSTPVDSIKLVEYNNRNKPLNPTDSMYVWKADQYIHDFDKNGKVVDSHFVTANKTWYSGDDSAYKVFEVVDPIEIGRAATPYSGNRQEGWNYPWYFDVTDYQNLMQGTQRLRAFYRGPRDGFTIHLEFIMIEGTPSRDPISVKNIYKSPARGWYYSFDTSDINNDRLYTKQLTMPSEAKEAKVRVSIKGHGFGDANGNCAEFCEKWYKVLVDGNEVAKQTVWRDNCDMTPVYPQTGTWILSRSNWCPGTESFPYDHEITDQVKPGGKFDVKMNMQSHTFLEPIDGNFTDPRWVIDAQLITYGEKNFDNDVSVTRIIAPNSSANQSRYNPTCGNPVVVIQNRGANTLKKATIRYGANSIYKPIYKWEGELEFMESDTVTLPNIGNWGEIYEDKNNFEVTAKWPNGKEDENKSNNTAYSEYNTVPKYPGKFRLRLRTNKAPGETSYKITNSKGEVVYERSEFDAQTTYYDTFNLEPGCYEFLLKDRRGAPFQTGDGLNFFCCRNPNSRICNNEGCGTARFIEIDRPFPLDNGFFENNFGRRIRKSFTVGYTFGNETPEGKAFLDLYPNPAGKKLQADLFLTKQQSIDVTIVSTVGRVLHKVQYSNYKNEGFSLNTAGLKPGIYFLRIKTEGDTITKRFIKE